MKSCLPGKTSEEKWCGRKSLKNTELGQNKKYFEGEDGPIFGGGRKPVIPRQISIREKTLITVVLSDL
jgi:hypothetical protein